jgi:Ca2+-binding EF-hand superfamily protein
LVRQAGDRSLPDALQSTGQTIDEETLSMKRVLAMALGLGLMGVVLQAAEAKNPQGTSKGQASTLSRGLEKYDKNGDGKLDTAEREAMREARRKEFIAKYDKNGDGKVDEEEMKPYLEEQRKAILERAKSAPPPKQGEKQSDTK